MFGVPNWLYSNFDLKYVLLRVFMQSENLLESDLRATGTIQKKSRSKKANLLIWLHSITFVLGFALLVLVMYWLGYRTILESLSRVGWGFLPIIALNVIRHFLRASSMYLAVPREHRNFKYRNAVAARFGGEAVSFLTFTGPFLGDATKAILLKKNVSLTQGASAVLIDNVLYYVSVILMILAGVGAFVYYFESSSRMMSGVLWAIVICSVLIFAVLSLAIRYKITPLSRIIAMLERRRLAPKFVLKMRDGILNVETNVFQFYHQRRTDFFVLFGISSFVHVVSMCEVFLALKLLGFESFWSTAFIIESLTKVINVIFSFVPGTIGVYEGGNSVILLSLGYTAVVGVELALVRRVAIMFSLFVGLVILLWRTVDRGTKTLVKPTD